MTIQPAGGGRRRSPLHAAAALTLLTFGCTTVRAPVSVIAPTVAVNGPAAEPQVELWLESARHVTPEESAQATAQAREALRHALEGRMLGADDVLVVRAQAVSRTRSHRNDQRAAVAGIAVGAVAIVAVVVLALASGKGGGSSFSGPGLRSAARGGGGVRPGAVPVPVPGAVPPRGVPVPARGMPRVAAGGSRHGAANVDVNVGLVVDARIPAPAEPDLYVPAAHVQPLPPEPAPERITAVTLPPPAPLDVERRSFFDGDWLRIELRVIDARTGAVRWAKESAAEIDVRDARKVRAAVDRALAETDGWYAPAPGAH